MLLLANAVRICDAKFGTLFLTEGDAFRYVALHGAPPAFAEARRREPVTRVKPGTTLGRVAATKKPAQTADIRAEPAYTSDPSGFRSGACRRAYCTRCADAQGKPTRRRHCHLPPGSSPVHRQADRSAIELRCAGRHRHREHAVAQRAEAIVGAADGDLGGAARSSAVRPANCNRYSDAMLANATRICDAKFATSIPARRRRLPRGCRYLRRTTCVSRGA